MTDQSKQLEKLREAFPPSQIGKLPKGGVFLDFVGHGYITARLLDVDPLWNWEPLATDEHGLPLFDEYGGLWIKLSVCGVTRLGYGDAGGRKGTNAIKEAVGDALRNAAMRFGAALELWQRGDPDAAATDRTHRANEQQDAIGELATACAALGLDNRDAAQRFYTAFGTTVREASADQIREFVKALHTNGVPADVQGDLMDLVPCAPPTKPQLQKLAILRQEAGYSDDDDGRVDWFQYVQTVIGRLVSSNKDLTKDEAIALITALQKTKEPTS